MPCLFYPQVLKASSRYTSAHNLAPAAGNLGEAAQQPPKKRGPGRPAGQASKELKQSQSSKKQKADTVNEKADAQALVPMSGAA